MKRQYREVSFTPKGAMVVKRCATLLEKYEALGIRVTLRQLYYRLVAANVIANTKQSYKWLSAVVSDARYAGLLDWDAIEDRVRQPWTPQDYKTMREALQLTMDTYRLKRWRGQRHYVEIWVEKDALASVLEPLAARFHVTLMVNRGYSSSSAMYESAQRLMRRCNLPTWDGHDPSKKSKRPVVLYFGDHDPSGINMIDDCRDRLVEFGVEGLAFKRIALSYKQVESYACPPNPVKLTDSRAKGYIARWGRTCWELDAIDPPEFHKLVAASIAPYLDQALMDKVKAAEEADKGKLKKAMDDLWPEAA